MKSLFIKTMFIAITIFAIAGTLQNILAGGENLEKAPPGGKYKKVSTLVELPEFVPGLGILYVDPDTLPAGPFLAYDREGNLVSSVYMIPLKNIDEHKAFNGLNVAPQKVDHVDLYYNAGHPGVPEPHYHVILWYVSPEKAEALNK
jgi:hypothetical protein